MNLLRNEKGFALGFVLILAVIALVMTLSMLFMVSRGSYVSGQQKRYRTALEASRGGAEAILQIIGTRGTATTPYTNLFLGTALTTKLTSATSTWASPANSSVTIDPKTNTTYDVRIDLGTYTVYMKVIDTVVGNTGVNEGLLKSGVVSTTTGEISGMAIPYLYTIEVLSQSSVNPTERSKLSVLYQY
jgi:Tfp pilus assembly protein PilX